MKVLFVYSGNFQLFPISPFTKSQAESLRERGVEVEYFPVVGKGFGYLKNVAPLRKKLEETRPDLIHAHYSLCGWVAVLAAGKLPVVLSLMGDDAQGAFTGKNKVEFKSRFFILLTWLIQPFLRAIIFKAPNLEKAVYRKKIAHLVPNGVRLEQFEIAEKGYRAELGLEPGKQYVLFLGNPDDPNKNGVLAQEAVRLLNRPDVTLLQVYGVSHEKVVQYLNSVDVFVLCSFGEGSPNVVKEAMTCSCPMVVTPAGDAAWVLGNTGGCYVASYEAADFAQKLSQALDFAAAKGRTKGRERILELGLDAGSVAKKIHSIYQKVLSQA
ncbi:MAG: glycosyltransferase [Saprospirales bacterium]|nr:glycosyltransferase [Saprospirales bacterium]